MELSFPDGGICEAGTRNQFSLTSRIIYLMMESGLKPKSLACEVSLCLWPLACLSPVAPVFIKWLLYPRERASVSLLWPLSQVMFPDSFWAGSLLPGPPPPSSHGHQGGQQTSAGKTGISPGSGLPPLHLSLSPPAAHCSSNARPRRPRSLSPRSLSFCIPAISHWEARARDRVCPQQALRLST